MLTSMSASSMAAHRGDPAILLSIAGGDISLGHKRREGGAALLWMKISVTVHGIQIHRV